jgi:uncharacterized protein
MRQPAALPSPTPPPPPHAPHARAAFLPEARPLAPEHAREVLDFLAARPLHTVLLAGLVRDNGLVSPLNRGTFYGCRDRRGRLEGVALIGHATLLETRTERALAAFAELARRCPRTHMILGERERVSEFWGHYRSEGRRPRLACRELLFELRFPVEAREEVEGLRQATLDDLELVAPVQAAMARDESGVDPLEVDPEGFRRRCARRIEQGRTWVVVRDGRVVFKAEVQAETPEVCYLEGIHVAPAERGRGLGARCLSQLCRTLLRRVPSLMLLANEANVGAHALYRKVGFRPRAVYETIFLGLPAD